MDKIYAFDKITKLGTLLGEIQTEFNMSFVIDGTKDSAKVVVHSWDENEIEPYTIIYHANTQSWWIVSNDKVERYQNESGFLYVHNLTLLGAIELCNARDLTDCGFNQNTYTIEEFILRLFSLSNFEYNYNSEYFFQANYNFLQQKVKFVKTFENYTLLSALREFLDGYNMVAKLGFGANYYENTDTYEITATYLYIISKTGEYSNTHDLDDFDDTRETKTIDKNSFGSTVVSNAENVISTEHKQFPSTGTVKVSANEYRITPDNALIRLPSKLYQANWLKIVTNKAPLRLNIHYFGKDVLEQEPISCNAFSSLSIENAWNTIRDLIIQYTTQAIYNGFENAFESEKERVVEELKKASAVTLYNGNVFNPVTGEIQKGANVPYLVMANFHSKEPSSLGIRPFIFCDKALKETLSRPWQAIAWERGSNIISGFDGFQGVTGSQNSIYVKLYYTDLRALTTQYVYFEYAPDADTRIILATQYNPSGAEVIFHFGPSATGAGDVSFIIDYIPMTDLKVKVDNTREKRDIQLYNQNGKLTDNVALSKLINSYSKEISSDTITRYMQYYSFNEIPKVGDIVYKGNVNYVINNVSLDFMQNENETYYIEAEITMSKYVSTKSLLTNPNTNIRDYGIPQNFNVKRKQLYRDYYELAYQTFDSANQDTPYLATDNILSFGHSDNIKPEFIGVIKLGYEGLVEGETNWYYQLETTTYTLDKMLYVVLDFNDNNIIGYGNQNVFSGFDVSRIFNGGMFDTLNTPISYTDENGKVMSVDLLLCNIEQITSIYDDYQESHAGSSWDGTLYNYSVFIPSDIYDNALLDNQYLIRITEDYYNKDAIEVPVFEYACQIDDSEDVLIGDNILTQHSGYAYFYSFVQGDNLTPNTAFDDKQVTEITSPFVGYQIVGGANIEYEELGTLRLLRVTLFNYQRFNVNNNEWVNAQQIGFVEGKDYAIFRHAVNLYTLEEIVDLVLIAKKVPYDHLTLDNKILTLEINHYKLN